MHSGEIQKRMLMSLGAHGGGHASLRETAAYRDGMIS